jgi:hypothetical protein
MTDASEFKKHAKECMAMAPKMRPESRALLITIAEAWLVLAHAAELKARRSRLMKLKTTATRGIEAALVGGTCHD